MEVDISGNIAHTNTHTYTQTHSSLVHLYLQLMLNTYNDSLLIPKERTENIKRRLNFLNFFRLMS